MHRYGPDFFRFLASFAVASAERVVPVVRRAVGVRSVVDFGCGQGAWLSVWSRDGTEIQGVDGDYVDRAGLLVPEAAFRVADLNRPINLGRRYDLAQSLEVAEHLTADRAEAHVATLVTHAPVVLFSAAVPGQGGEHHVNEQPPEYWRALFRARGYLPIDWVRPAVRDERAVQQWYRCNTLLYVSEAALDLVAPEARCALVPDDVPIANVWPLSQRLRHAVLRPLPVAVVDALARLSARRLRSSAPPS